MADTPALTRMQQWAANRATHRAKPDFEPHERTPDDNCGPDKCLDCGRRGCALCDNPCPARTCGFTREDVCLTEWAGTSFAANPAFAREAAMMRSLADRIAALLPPE